MVEAIISFKSDLTEKWLEHIGELVLRQEKIEQRKLVSLVIVSDKKIQTLNKEFLNHDRPTDVIAFPLEDELDEMLGEVYVSRERAAEQAVIYGASFPREMARLVIHGILHLCGFRDHSAEEKEKMRIREDYYLAECFKEGLLQEESG